MYFEIVAILRFFFSGYVNTNLAFLLNVKHEINFVKFKTSHALGKITKIFTLNLQLIETRIEQWRQKYDREKKMYEKEIRKVRNEIGNAQKYLEELTTEVMIRKLYDSARNILISFRATGTECSAVN